LAAKTPATTETTRELYNGFGDTLTVAFELALIPVIFAGLGLLLDNWLGTRPLFLVFWVVLAAAGLGAKMYYRYKLKMDELEAEAPWRK
jgi:F0F1-type ATP synthase assembly protein I